MFSDQKGLKTHKVETGNTVDKIPGKTVPRAAAGPAAKKFNQH